MDRSTDFEVIIDFVPGVGDPARVFKAMAGLVASFGELDKHLVASIDAAVGASLVLEEVAAGSIKAILRGVVSDLPDEALKNADWKK